MTKHHRLKRLSIKPLDTLHTSQINQAADLIGPLETDLKCCLGQGEAVHILLFLLSHMHRPLGFTARGYNSIPEAVELR